MIDIDPARKAKRIAEDIDMMQHPERWPDVILHLKTQPWQPHDAHGWPAFGFMNAGSLNVIIKDSGGKHETFETIEELAERWSVD